MTFRRSGAYFLHYSRTGRLMQIFLCRRENLFWQFSSVVNVILYDGGEIDGDYTVCGCIFVDQFQLGLHSTVLHRTAFVHADACAQVNMGCCSGQLLCTCKYPFTGQLYAHLANQFRYQSCDVSNCFCSVLHANTPAPYAFSASSFVCFSRDGLGIIQNDSGDSSADRSTTFSSKRVVLRLYWGCRGNHLAWHPYFCKYRYTKANSCEGTYCRENGIIALSCWQRKLAAGANFTFTGFNLLSSTF